MIFKIFKITFIVGVCVCMPVVYGVPETCGH